MVSGSASGDLWDNGELLMRSRRGVELRNRLQLLNAEVKAFDRLHIVRGWNIALDERAIDDDLGGGRRKAGRNLSWLLRMPIQLSPLAIT
jgi:hypothetical protein